MTDEPELIPVGVFFQELAVVACVIPATAATATAQTHARRSNSHSPSAAAVMVMRGGPGDILPRCRIQYNAYAEALFWRPAAEARTQDVPDRNDGFIDEQAVMIVELQGNVDRAFGIRQTELAVFYSLEAGRSIRIRLAEQFFLPGVFALAGQRLAVTIVSAGRVGARLGKVSELTLVVPLAPGGADRLRTFLKLLGGNLAGADDVGSVHDMRFVFLDNDTKMLFATAYDGDWDTYIDDFATKIPDYLDIIDSAWEGWPGIRSPEAKDYLAKYQITAEGWYVANDLTVAETRRLMRIGQAVDEFLDKVGD